MSQHPNNLEDYPWPDAEPSCAHDYLLPELDEILAELDQNPQQTRALDLGCGNGVVTAWLADRGFDVVGVDPSKDGIKRARSAHPELEFHRRSAYEPLHEDLGTFPLVVSLEVVEHIYDPPAFVRTAFHLTAPGGVDIFSTPYHGWLKNVAIAALGRFDDHVDPIRVHGHIKFWSRKTLTRLLEDAGYDVREFCRAGRILPLAKSLIAVARRCSVAGRRGRPED